MKKLADVIKEKLLPYSFLQVTTLEPSIRVTWADMSRESRKIFERLGIDRIEIPVGKTLATSPFHAHRSEETDQAYLSRLVDIYSKMYYPETYDDYGNIEVEWAKRSFASPEGAYSGVKELLKAYKHVWDGKDDQNRSLALLYTGNTKFLESLERKVQNTWYPTGFSPFNTTSCAGSVAKINSRKASPVDVRFLFLVSVVREYFPEIAQGMHLPAIACYNYVNIFKLMIYFAEQSQEASLKAQFEEEYEMYLSVISNENTMYDTKYLAAHLIYPFVPVFMLPMMVNIYTTDNFLDSYWPIMSMVANNPSCHISSSEKSNTMIACRDRAEAIKQVVTKVLSEEEYERIIVLLNDTSTFVEADLTPWNEFEDFSISDLLGSDFVSNTVHNTHLTNNKPSVKAKAVSYLAGCDTVFGWSASTLTKAKSISPVVHNYVLANPKDFAMKQDVHRPIFENIFSEGSSVSDYSPILSNVKPRTVSDL